MAAAPCTNATSMQLPPVPPLRELFRQAVDEGLVSESSIVSLRSDQLWVLLLRAARNAVHAADGTTSAGP